MRRALALAVLGATLLTTLVLPGSPSQASDGATIVCRFTDQRFTEISGMTMSLRHRDVLWLHNDSGDGPRIYAVDGHTCRTLATVTLRGVTARDVEAIAATRDSRGRPVLWVADIGDNLDSWPEVRLYRIREPRRLVDQTVTARAFRVTYSDMPHNAETLLADPSSGRLWIVTKQLAHGRIYSLPRRLSATGLTIARPVATVGGLVTDGAMSPDGTRYVLRDYVFAQVFDGRPPGRLTTTIDLPLQPQGEAITWTADGTALLIASEGDDRLLRVDAPRTDAMGRRNR